MPFDPTMGELHYDEQLRDLSVAYIQADDHFIHDKVFPAVDVKEKSGKYIKLSKEDFFRNDVEIRKPGEEPNISGHGITRGDYNTEEYALAAMVDDQEKANATPPYDPMDAKSKMLVQKHMINADVLWAGTFFAAAAWASAVTGVAAAPSTPGEFIRWNDSGAVPLDDINEQKVAILGKTGFEPNVLVCGYKAWFALKNSAQVAERHKYTSGGPISTEIVARLLEIDRIVVSKSIRTTSNKGAATATFGFNLTNTDALLVYAAPAPGLETVSGGYSFRWTGLKGAGGTPVEVGTTRIPTKYSDWISTRMAFGFGQVSNELGAYFTNASA